MVHGSLIARPAEGALADARFASCPIAEVRVPDGWVVRAMRSAAQHAAGVPLRDIVSEPTPALLESVRVLAETRAEMSALDRRLAQQAAG